jgi:hypothetical protein
MESNSIPGEHPDTHITGIYALTSCTDPWLPRYLNGLAIPDSNASQYGPTSGSP